jgi:hypothetical protein
MGYYKQDITILNHHGWALKDLLLTIMNSNMYLNTCKLIMCVARNRFDRQSHTVVKFLAILGSPPSSKNHIVEGGVS